MDVLKIPDLKPGTALVLRPAKQGGVRVSLRQASGYQFVSHEEVAGFVQDARAMLRVLSQMNMPRRWFRAWLVLLSLQEYENASWELRLTQDEISKACNVPRTALQEPLEYFESIGWICRPRRGLILLNPWLTSCGNSTKQAEAQASWLIYGPSEFIIPGRDHPSDWLAARKRERVAAESALLFTLPLGGESGDAGETDEPPRHQDDETVVLRYRNAKPESALEAEDGPGRGTGQRTPVSKGVRQAMDELGNDAELSRIEKWLADQGIMSNPRTLASAVSRERTRRRAS